MYMPKSTLGEVLWESNIFSGLNLFVSRFCRGLETPIMTVLGPFNPVDFSSVLENCPGDGFEGLIGPARFIFDVSPEIVGDYTLFTQMLDHLELHQITQ